MEFEFISASFLLSPSCYFLLCSRFVASFDYFLDNECLVPLLITASLLFSLLGFPGTESITRTLQQTVALRNRSHLHPQGRPVQVASRHSWARQAPTRSIYNGTQLLLAYFPNTSMSTPHQHCQVLHPILHFPFPSNLGSKGSSLNKIGFSRSCPLDAFHQGTPARQLTANTHLRTLASLAFRPSATGPYHLTFMEEAENLGLCGEKRLATSQGMC